MVRKPVQSSNVIPVGYDPKSRTLEVEFRGGSVYRYAGVPADAHAALLSAASVGAHLAQHVKGTFPATKV